MRKKYFDKVHKENLMMVERMKAIKFRKPPKFFRDSLREYSPQKKVVNEFLYLGQDKKFGQFNHGNMREEIVCKPIHIRKVKPQPYKNVKRPTIMKRSAYPTPIRIPPTRKRIAIA